MTSDPAPPGPSGERPEDGPGLRRASPADIALCFLSGGILTLMILCNGTVAGVTTGTFASLAAHGTGTVAAAGFLALLGFRRRGAGPRPAARGVPVWTYLGGVAGAATVVMGSIAVNSPLALSGMIALGLAGQTVYSLAADAWGWFGLPVRRPDLRDGAVIALIGAGCLVIVFRRRGVTGAVLTFVGRAGAATSRPSGGAA